MTDSVQLTIIISHETHARLARQATGERMRIDDLARWLIEAGLGFLETGSEDDIIAELAVAKALSEVEGIAKVHIGPLQRE